MTTLTNIPATPSPSPSHPKMRERVNLRLYLFLGVVSLLFVWVLWVILNPHTIEWKGDYYAVDLKWMGNFPFQADRDTEAAIPKKVRELDGKKVRFEGEMYAPNSAGDVESFQLVYSIVECCFGGEPKVQERVFAFAPKGKTIPNYTGQQVTVIGTLHVGVKRANGKTISVFTMDVDEIRPRT